MFEIVRVKIPSTEQIVTYFDKRGMTELVEKASGGDTPIDKKLNQISPYKPSLEDLYVLHQSILKNKKTTVLEFGTGWSSLVMADALKELRKEGVNGSAYRRVNMNTLFSVDNEQKYIRISRRRIEEAGLCEHVRFFRSDVRMREWNGRVCTLYDTLPNINPDFIYLDGPDQFKVKGEVRGITLRVEDMVPMAGDLLGIEHFLMPGTVIIVDGRGSNARFLRSNLQRNWEYSYSKDLDQHTFILNEDPVGRIGEKMIEEYTGRTLYLYE